MSAVGRIHSFQSMGAVDGPGLRCVFFLQGCPLRCAYCHNPDTWEFGGGEEITAEAAMARVLRYRKYIRSGGVTLSGGEPLAQGAFAGELFARLRQEGIHTALDTSGAGSPAAIDAVLRETDLVLCDVKFPTEEGYARHARGSLAQVLSFLEEVGRRQIPLWIRHVVVPGLTDGEESLHQVAAIARTCPTLEKVELLPFRKICQTKYDSMGIPFPLAHIPELHADGLEQAKAILSAEGIPL